jgi:hypothetical protein
VESRPELEQQVERQNEIEPGRMAGGKFTRDEKKSTPGTAKPEAPKKIITMREGLQGAALQSEPRKPGGEKSRTGNGFPLQRRKSTKETNKKNQKSRFRPRKRAKQNELRHNHEN